MVLEVACDESGSEGEKLVGGVTDVFAHASVPVGLDVARAVVLDVRRRIRSPAEEYKANHLLREKHRDVLLWWLGESGPIHGRAHVHLTDKTFFLLTRILDDGPARVLRRAFPAVLGAVRWAAFLDSVNNLLRVRIRRGETTSADAFFRTVDHLRRFDLPDDLAEALGLVAAARPAVEAHRADLRDRPRALPALDPMIPAILRTVRHWSADGPVAVVHDEQLSLTAHRIERITELAGGRLASLRLVDSRDDARVQLADFLAGVARRIASDELDGRGDAELVALLRPYVDPASTWSG